MLTVAEETLRQLAAEHGKQVSTHLYGQEINAETCAICKADLLLKGEGEAADNRTEGETKGRAEAAREILRTRGVACSGDLFAGIPDGVPGSAVVAAALACDSERDFHARLRATSGSEPDQLYHAGFLVQSLVESVAAAIGQHVSRVRFCSGIPVSARTRPRRARRGAAGGRRSRRW